MTRVGFALVVALLLGLVPRAVRAGSYDDLTPGQSTKREADQQLGPPLRGSSFEMRYDYDPGPHDADRVSLRFDPASGVIESIDIYPSGAYTKDVMRRLLRLGEPDRLLRDASGNLIERYSPQGVDLHYVGASDTRTVRFFSHVATQTAPKKSVTEFESAAREALADKNCDRGKQLVDEGIGLYPSSAVLWEQRLKYYFRCSTEPDQLRFGEALRAAQRSFELSATPTNAVNLGWVYFEMYRTTPRRSTISNGRKTTTLPEIRRSITTSDAHMKRSVGTSLPCSITIAF